MFSVNLFLEFFSYFSFYSFGILDTVIFLHNLKFIFKYSYFLSLFSDDLFTIIMS
jgi:hypothetical protein